MARKRARSSSGSVGVLGQLEHPLVELQPADLAVQEAVGRQLLVVDHPDELAVGSARSRGQDGGVRTGVVAVVDAVGCMVDGSVVDRLGRQGRPSWTRWSSCPTW